MNFLQRLATHAVGETGADAASVRAALPSRFATRATPSPQPDEAAPSAYETSTQRLAAWTERPTPEPGIEGDPGGGRLSASKQASPPRSSTGAVEGAADALSSPRPAAAHVPQRWPAPTPHPVEPPARTVASVMAALFPSAERPTAPTRSTGLVGEPTPEPSSRPEAHAMPALPLSATTVLAARRQGEDDAHAQPPVIHVTIDRIDIRAPGAAARPASPARTPRHTAPSQSLADYLRGRPRGAGGSS